MEQRTFHFTLYREKRSVRNPPAVMTWLKKARSARLADIGLYGLGSEAGEALRLVEAAGCFTADK
jgi:hypothetical protein